MGQLHIDRGRYARKQGFLDCRTRHIGNGDDGLLLRQREELERANRRDHPQTQTGSRDFQSIPADGWIQLGTDRPGQFSHLEDVALKPPLPHVVLSLICKNNGANDGRGQPEALRRGSDTVGREKVEANYIIPDGHIIRNLLVFLCRIHLKYFFDL